MIQVALFLVILFAVTWPLGFLLPSILGTGSVWKFLCSIAALGLGANDHCSDVDAMDGGAIRAEKRTPFTSELPPRFDSMVDTGGPGSHTRLRNRDVQRAGGWRRSSIYLVKCDFAHDWIASHTGAVGEELGWRGFLLPRLAMRFGEVGAALAMGLLWSFWHVRAFFTPGMPHQEMPVVSTLAFITFFGVFLALIFNRTGKLVLATMLAHLTLNIMLAAGGARLSSVVFWRTLAGVFGMLAVFGILASRTRPPDELKNSDSHDTNTA